MARQTSRLIGFEEVEKILEGFPLKLQEKAILNPLRAGARVISKDMKRRVQKRTGELQKSITVATNSRKKRAKNPTDLVQIGFRKPTSRRAHLLEFGTKFSRAFPFIRPAFDARAGDAIKRIGDQLKALVEKIARGESAKQEARRL